MRQQKDGQLDPSRTRLLMQKWADGKATLKEVRGYTEEELYSVCRAAYVFYHQGHLEEARTLFQGLYAVDPLEPYFARALGVVELAAGNVAGALAAYDVAIRLDPDEPAGYVGRAEIRISQGQKSQAIEDLRRAYAVAGDDDPQKAKVSALLDLLMGR